MDAKISLLTKINVCPSDPIVLIGVGYSLINMYWL